MTIVFAFAFAGLASAVYWGVNYFRAGQSNTQPAVVLEHPTRSGAKPHPIQKYIEVAGIRFLGDKKETKAKFLVVNHSGAEITNLGANLTVWGRTQRSEEDAVGTITFQVPDIGPNESKEVTATLTTRLKVYELPDWQNVTIDMQVTSPPAP